jgi:hypothetical protein
MPYRCCEDFLHDHQGRTFGTPGRPALVVLAEDARDVYGEALNKRRAPRRAARMAGSLAPGSGQPGPLPLARQRTGAGRCPPRRYPPHPLQQHPARHAPWITRTVRTDRAVVARRMCRSPGERVRGTGAGTPRIVRVGPSSVKGTRRSFLTASQKRSSGPALERRRPLPTLRA